VQALRTWTAAVLAAALAPALSAGWQTSPLAQQFPPTTARPPSPDSGPPPPRPPATERRAAPPAAEQRPASPAARASGGPAVTGTWSGPVTQVGSKTKYSIVLTLTGAGGETTYPEIPCAGKLTRIGASKSYVFFIEVITEGQREKGGRCPDGTITVGRLGDNLTWAWFGNVDDEPVLAYGVLTRKR
jgi:hypothetical protein